MRGTARSMNDNGRGVPALPTSRAAPHGERAVLAILRAKAPHRALDLREAAQVAEWQAITLLELAGLSAPPTPASLIRSCRAYSCNTTSTYRCPAAPRGATAAG